MRAAALRWRCLPGPGGVRLAAACDFCCLLLSSCLLLSFAGAALPLNGQDTRNLVPVVEIGGSLTDSVLLLEHSTVAWDHTHDVITVAPIGAAWQYGTFSSSGELLGVHGKYGEGPGEIQEIFNDVVSLDGRFLYSGDPNFIADVTGEFVQTVPLTLTVNDFAYAGSDSLLVSATTYAGDRVTLFDIPSMRVLGTYFPTPAQSLHDMDPFSYVASPVGDKFAATSVADCLVSTLDFDSSESSETRAGDWCTPWTAPYESPSESRPRPHISDVRLLSDGTVWIIGVVADADWRPGAEAPQRMFDTVVEVVRPDGSREEFRLHGSPLTALDGPWVATRSQNDLGVVSITIWGYRTPNIPQP